MSNVNECETHEPEQLSSPPLGGNRGREREKENRIQGQDCKRKKKRDGKGGGKKRERLMKRIMNKQIMYILVVCINDSF